MFCIGGKCGIFTFYRSGSPFCESLSIAAGGDKNKTLSPLVNGIEAEVEVIKIL